jgi:hypothetical protein
MSSRLGALRRLITPLVTLVVLAAVFGIYYLHVRSQAANFDNRNLRRLATMSRQIESTVKGYADAVRSTYENGPEVQLNLSQFLADQTDLIFEHDLAPDRGSGTTSDLALSVTDGKLILDYFPHTLRESRPPWLQLHLHPVDPSSNNFKRDRGIRVYAKLGDLMARFVPRDPVADPFDVVALADEQGGVLYQSTFSEVRLDNLSRLFTDPMKPAPAPPAGQSSSPPAPPAGQSPSPPVSSNAPSGSWDDVLAMSGLREMEIVGGRYKVYTQPVTLNLDPTSKPRTWVLCGLVRPERFTSQTWALSYFWIIGLAFLVVIVVLSLPIVKLAGRGASLLRTDTPIIAAAIFLIPALTALFTAYVYQHASYVRLTDEALKALANDIDHNFTQETRNIVDQIDYLTGRLRDLKNPYADERLVLSKETMSRLSISIKDSHYTNFEMIYWADEQGHEQVKWSRARDITPLLSLEQNPVYRRFREERKALLDHKPTEGSAPEQSQESARKFTFEPLTTTTTGESVAVFGRPLDGKTRAGQTPLTAAFMVCTPESLFHPVLPLGFGFAIVDDSGNVVFSHSPLLNQRENLFQETDDDKKTQSAIHSSLSEPFNVQYKGRLHRVYVRPLQQIHRSPRLSLVVYKDGIYDETLNAEIAGMAATLYGEYVLLLLAVLGGFRLFLWSRVRIWFRGKVWPSEERKPEYAAIFLALAPLAGLSFLSLFLQPFVLQLLLLPLEALILAALAIFIAGRVLSRGAPLVRFQPLKRLHQRLAARPMAEVVTLACAALILDVSVLPAGACFRMAHLHETLNFLLVGQKEIADELERRYDPRETSRLQWVDQEIRDPMLRPSDTDEDTSPYLYHRTYLGSRLRVIGDKLPRSRGEDFWRKVRRALFASTSGIVDAAHARFNRIAMEEPGDWLNLGADPYLYWDLHAEDLRDDPPPKFPDGGIVIHKRAYGNDPQWMLNIWSELPPLVDWRQWLGAPFAVTVAYSALGLLSFFLGLRWLLGRIFQIDLRLPAESVIETIPDTVSRHTIFLRSPWQTSDGLEAIAGAEILDFAHFISAGLITADQCDIAPRAEVVAIRNFEFGLGDPAIELARLTLLETLVYSARCIVVVASSIDPQLQFSSASAPAVAVRWRDVLAAFDRVLLRPPIVFTAPDPPTFDSALGPAERAYLLRVFVRECSISPKLRAIGKSMAASGTVYSTEEQIVNEIDDRARDLYALLWAGCSAPERLALYRLAYHRRLNLTDREAILELRRKGLIVLDPGARCFNESFHRYVLTASDLSAAEAEDRESSPGWSRFSIVIGAALAGIALIVLVAVFLGQKETLQSGLGYVTAAVGAITTVTRVFSARAGVPSPGSLSA